MTEKASNIQSMMRALGSIEKRTAGILDYATQLSGTELTMEGSVQLFAYMKNVRAQIRAFVGMMNAYREKQRLESDSTPGLAQGFRAKDVMNVDPKASDLRTAEGVQAFIESMRTRIESISSYEGYLKEQLRLLIEESNELEQDIVSVMKANGRLNSALAMEMAGMASEQLLKGFDILLGLEEGREKNRVAKLLQVDVVSSLPLR